MDVSLVTDTLPQSADKWTDSYMHGRHKLNYHISYGTVRYKYIYQFFVLLRDTCDFIMTLLWCKIYRFYARSGETFPIVLSDIITTYSVFGLTFHIIMHTLFRHTDNAIINCNKIIKDVNTTSLLGKHFDCGILLLFYHGNKFHSANGHFSSWSHCCDEACVLRQLKTTVTVFLTACTG